MTNNKFLRAVQILTGSYDPNDPTTKPRGALTTFYLDSGRRVPVWLDPSTMIDALPERAMPQDDRFIEQLKSYWYRRKMVTADRDRVRKEFKGLHKELARNTGVCSSLVKEVKLRINNHLHALDSELKQAESQERQCFLRRLRSEYKPLLSEADAILRDSKKFEKDARSREKLFKAAMHNVEFSQDAIQNCGELLPILRQEIISSRLAALSQDIDSLIDDAIVYGEVFKRDEEYQPLINKAVKGIEATLAQFANHLMTGEPERLKELKLTLKSQREALEKLKRACAAPENSQPSPELEEELQTRLCQIMEKADAVIDELMNQELNVADLSKIERNDRLEAIGEIRNQVISGIFLAMSSQEPVSELQLENIVGVDAPVSTGSPAVDSQRIGEQERMLKDYADIQKQMSFSIEYGGKTQDIIRDALAALPPQATNREKSLLKVAIKELATQAHIQQAKEARFSAQAGVFASAGLQRISKPKIRRVVDLWQRSGDSDQLQARQSQFFDRLLKRGVKYKNVWVEKKKEIGMQESGAFADFRQDVLAKDGYDIPGIDQTASSYACSPGSKERVQELLKLYPRLFDDCVEYVTNRVDVEEIPKHLQNDYIGLMVAYLLEQNTLTK